VSAEESETPGGESGPPPGGSGRGTEGDLLAERRARRAAESGETALIRRAEAAEATVRTLETHVTSLQQRLLDAEDERQEISELVESQQVSAGDRSLTIEHELRRAKQREYAEQQLRVEAEARSIESERESRMEIERLSRRLGASERAARGLADQLEDVQRELAEAQHSAVAELEIVRRAGDDFQLRLAELERRALEIHRGLEAERMARQRSERLLENMRQGHRWVEGLVGELRGVVGRLRVAAAAEPAPDRPAALERHRGESPNAPRGEAREADRDAMTKALAAAVDRLRARVEDVAEATGELEEGSSAPAIEMPAEVGEDAPAPPIQAPAPAAAAVVSRAQHRHSVSALERWRIRRKDRRERRSAAARPPSMQSQ
jgi:hypothetical protein